MSTIQSRALAEFIAGKSKGNLSHSAKEEISEWMPTPDEEVIETTIPSKESPQE